MYAVNAAERTCVGSRLGSAGSTGNFSWNWNCFSHVFLLFDWLVTGLSSLSGFICGKRLITSIVSLFLVLFVVHVYSDNINVSCRLTSVGLRITLQWAVWTRCSFSRRSKIVNEKLCWPCHSESKRVLETSQVFIAILSMYSETTWTWGCDMRMFKHCSDTKKPKNKKTPF